MIITKVALGLVFVVALGMLILNVAGHSLFTYFHVGEKDLIVGSSNSSLHLAWADANGPAQKEDLNRDFDFDFGYRELVSNRMVDVFMERPGPCFHPFPFRVSHEKERPRYRSVDLPVFPVAILIAVLGIVVVRTA